MDEHMLNCPQTQINNFGNSGVYLEKITVDDSMIKNYFQLPRNWTLRHVCQHWLYTECNATKITILHGPFSRNDNELCFIVRKVRIQFQNSTCREHFTRRFFQTQSSGWSASNLAQLYECYYSKKLFEKIFQFTGKMIISYTQLFIISIWCENVKRRKFFNSYRLNLSIHENCQLIKASFIVLRICLWINFPKV